MEIELGAPWSTPLTLDFVSIDSSGNACQYDYKRMMLYDSTDGYVFDSNGLEDTTATDSYFKGSSHKRGEIYLQASCSDPEITWSSIKIVASTHTWSVDDTSFFYAESD